MQVTSRAHQGDELTGGHGADRRTRALKRRSVEVLKMFGGGETLEEAMLTQNVPGRYSKWDKDDAPDRHDHDEHSSGEEGYQEDEPDGYKSEEDDPALKAIMDKREAEEEQVPEGIRDAIRRGERPGARTGVKGVLADYKAFKQAAYDQKQKEKRVREAILKRIAEGASEKLSAEQEQEAALAALQQKLSAAKAKLGQDDDDEDDEDDDFLEQYRRKRLQELKASVYLPVHGEIKEVSAFEFVDVLNKTDPRAKVVVHIYEPYIKACATLNKYLESMARKYVHTRFVRLQAGAAKQTAVDEVALPMLVVYQAGEVLETFARVHEEFPDSFLQEDVEWLLESRGLLGAKEDQEHKGRAGDDLTTSSVTGLARLRFTSDHKTD